MPSVKNSTPNTSGTGFFTDTNPLFFNSNLDVPLFGRNRDGDLTTATIWNMNTTGNGGFGRTADAGAAQVTSISGTTIVASQYYGSSLDFLSGDLCILVNQMGTAAHNGNVGNYEIVKLASSPIAPTLSGTSISNSVIQDTQQILAVNFTPGSNMTVNTIWLNLQGNNNGYLTGNVQVNIYSNSAGAPGSLLASSNSIATTALTPTVGSGPTSFLVPGGFALTGGTEYWFVLQTDNTFQTSTASGDNIQWFGVSGTSDTSKSTNNGGSWSVVSNQQLALGLNLGTTFTITNALVNNYGDTTNASIGSQIVTLQRIPEYGNVVLNSGGILTASAWTGSGGGLCVFMAQSVTCNGTGKVSAAGLGYRGGGLSGTPGTGEGYQGGYNAASIGASGGSGGGRGVAATSNGGNGLGGSGPTPAPGGGAGGAGGGGGGGAGGGGGYASAGGVGGATGGGGGGGAGKSPGGNASGTASISIPGGAGGPAPAPSLSAGGAGGNGTPGTGTAGGGTVGSAPLAQIFMGGGGGSAGAGTNGGTAPTNPGANVGGPGGGGGGYPGGTGGNPGSTSGLGGAGGGILLFWAQTVSALTARADGGTGQAGAAGGAGTTGNAGSGAEFMGGGGGGGCGGGGGGGGAAGTLYIVAQSITAPGATASGGAGGSNGAPGPGGAGGPNAPTPANAGGPGGAGNLGNGGATGGNGRCKIIYYTNAGVYASASADGAGASPLTSPAGFKVSL